MHAIFHILLSPWISQIGIFAHCPADTCRYEKIAHWLCNLLGLFPLTLHVSQKARLCQYCGSLPKGAQRHDCSKGNSSSACYRWKPPLLHRLFHPRTDPAAKVFGREGCGEGEPFSKKVSLLASCSLFTSSIVCLPSPKQKNPRWTGDKKRPPRAVSCKGVSNNLWQRPTFPHDVMQYHRRWRA